MSGAFVRVDIQEDEEREARRGWSKIWRHGCRGCLPLIRFQNFSGCAAVFYVRDQSFFIQLLEVVKNSDPHRDLEQVELTTHFWGLELAFLYLFGDVVACDFTWKLAG